MGRLHAGQMGRRKALGFRVLLMVCKGPLSRDMTMLLAAAHNAVWCDQQQMLLDYYLCHLGDTVCWQSLVTSYRGSSRSSSVSISISISRVGDSDSSNKSAGVKGVMHCSSRHSSSCIRCSNSISSSKDSSSSSNNDSISSSSSKHSSSCNRCSSNNSISISSSTG